MVGDVCVGLGVGCGVLKVGADVGLHVVASAQHRANVALLYPSGRQLVDSVVPSHDGPCGKRRDAGERKKKERPRRARRKDGRGWETLT